MSSSGYYYGSSGNKYGGSGSHHAGASSHYGGAASSSANQNPAGPPRRTPTDSSYYDCHGLRNSNHPQARDWHYARDVRAQVQAAGPKKPPGQPGYPSHYGNYDKPPLNLSASKPYTHLPIKPGTSRPYKKGAPGAHRAVYNEDDRSKIDVMYHDPKRPIPKGSTQRPFSLADYVPRA